MGLLVEADGVAGRAGEDDPVDQSGAIRMIPWHHLAKIICTVTLKCRYDQIKSDPPILHALFFSSRSTKRIHNPQTNAEKLTSMVTEYTKV